MTSLSDKPTESPPEPEDDKEWNEAALAELVGLENQSRAENANSSVSLIDEGNIIAQGDLFDAPVENPHENKTERSLAKKPLPKLAVVAAGLFVVFGIGGFAISSMMSSKKPNFTNPLAQKTDTKTSIVEKKGDVSNQSGELKTQLAISKQSDDLKAIDERSKDKKKEKGVKPGDKDKDETPGKNQKAAATPVKTSPAVANPPPARPYSSQPVRPAPVARPAPVPVPPPRVATSLPPPPPPPSPLAQNTLNQQPIKPSDPVEQWHTLAMIGSYGRVAQPSDEPNADMGNADMGNADMGKLQSPVARDKQKSSGRTMPSRESRESRQSRLHHLDAYAPTDAEQRVIDGVPTHRLKPGTTAAANLSTSLLWAEGSQDEKLIVVALTESLVGVDGLEVIPAGQQIVFTVSGVDSNGLVSAVATEIIDEEGNEQPLPTNAITLQADKERPLLASGLFDPGGEIAGMDLGIAALGAVAGVGEIMNRPLQQQSSSSTGAQTSTTTTSTSGDPNILGAIMQGGATPLLLTIQKRNEEAIKRLSDQKNAWFLPVGQSVQVVVTQPIEL